MAPSPVRLRPVAADPADLQAASDLWNAAVGPRHPLPAETLPTLYRQDPNARPGDLLLAEQAGIPVGMAWAKRWRDPLPEGRFHDVGFIAALAVHPDARGHGIGRTLLHALEARLAGEGCREVQVSGGFLHLLPGVPADDAHTRAFFERHGYTFEPTLFHDLIGDLTAYYSPLNLPPANVRLARPSEQAGLLAYLARAFPGTWERHARWHLANGGTPADFVLLEVDGQIEGFCHIYRPGSTPPGPSTYWSDAAPQPPSVGGLGPIGVSESLRGSGLGRTLMDGALRHLHRSGVGHCVIDWTTLVAFYRAFGFTPWRTYRRARRTLPG